MSAELECRLDEYAEKIRAIGKRAFADIVEIGRLLTAAKAIAGHGNWLPWLDKNFGWTDKTALNFMRVGELAAKSEKFSDLNIGISSLYLLAAPSTSDEVREAVVERSERGETLPHAEVKKMIADAGSPGKPPRTTAVKEETLEEKNKFRAFCLLEDFREVEAMTEDGKIEDSAYLADDERAELRGILIRMQQLITAHLRYLDPA